MYTVIVIGLHLMFSIKSKFVFEGKYNWFPITAFSPKVA